VCEFPPCSHTSAKVCAGCWSVGRFHIATVSLMTHVHRKSVFCTWWCVHTTDTSFAEYHSYGGPQVTTFPQFSPHHVNTTSTQRCFHSVVSMWCHSMKVLELWNILMSRVTPRLCHGARVALLWQHNANPGYKLASIPRYDDIVRTAVWAGSACTAGQRLAGDGGHSQNCTPYTGSGHGWLAGVWPSTGGVLNITAAAWTAGFHWWRSGNITQMQNVSEYMLVLALCLVQPADFTTWTTTEQSCA